MNDPVTVIIPAYNEESAIGPVVDQVAQVMNDAGVQHEIVVVDDGSEDRTCAIAQEHGAQVVRHEKNRGYGAALKSGVRAAQYDVLAMTDADGTYPIERIPDLLDELQSADLAVGARVSLNVDIPVVRRPAKWMLRRLAEYITSERIPDLNSGMRAFRRPLIEHYLDILPDKFSFTTTQTVALLCDSHKVVSVPIDYFHRVGKSKIVPWDFVSFVILVLRLSMLFNPLKVFVPIALGCFFLGGIKLILDIIFTILKNDELTFMILAQPIVSSTTLILLLSGLQILLVGMVSDALTRRIGHRMSSTPTTRSEQRVGKQTSRVEHGEFVD